QQHDSVVRELSECKQYKDAFEELRAKYDEATKREQLWQARAKTAELALRPPNRQQDPWTYPVQHPTSNAFTNLTPSLAQSSSRNCNPPTPPSPLPIPNDGCGGCKANGECPCVDEYTTVPPSAPSKLTTTTTIANIGFNNDDGSLAQAPPTLSRNMSIESMLSPTTVHTNASTRPSSSRGLGAQDSSFMKAESSATSQMDWTDQEVDFTTSYAKRSSSSSWGGGDGSSGSGVSVIGLSSLHSTTAAAAGAVKDKGAMPPPSYIPGTCDQCRANPEQKRFCEDLALRKAASEVSHARGHVGAVAPEEQQQQRRAKRLKVAPASAADVDAEGFSSSGAGGTGEGEVRLTCQEAYHFSKAVADSVPTLSERNGLAMMNQGRTESQVLFAEFVNSQPGSRRGTGMVQQQQKGTPDGKMVGMDMEMEMGAGQREGERQGRNMSLAEYDVVDVLATWRKSFAGGRGGAGGGGRFGVGEVESRDE
ncbi:hypothetical protein LTS18_005581, partial [Coniosporium uncinatum]